MKNKNTMTFKIEEQYGFPKIVSGPLEKLSVDQIAALENLGVIYTKSTVKLHIDKDRNMIIDEIGWTEDGIYHTRRPRQITDLVCESY